MNNSTFIKLQIVLTNRWLRINRDEVCWIRDIIEWATNNIRKIKLVFPQNYLDGKAITSKKYCLLGKY